MFTSEFSDTQKKKFNDAMDVIIKLKADANDPKFDGDLKSILFSNINTILMATNKTTKTFKDDNDALLKNIESRNGALSNTNSTTPQADKNALYIEIVDDIIKLKAQCDLAEAKAMPTPALQPTPVDQAAPTPAPADQAQDKSSGTNFTPFAIAITFCLAGIALAVASIFMPGLPFLIAALVLEGAALATGVGGVVYNKVQMSKEESPTPTINIVDLSITQDLTKYQEQDKTIEAEYPGRNIDISGLAGVTAHDPNPKKKTNFAEKEAAKKAEAAEKEIEI